MKIWSQNIWRQSLIKMWTDLTSKSKFSFCLRHSRETWTEWETTSSNCVLVPQARSFRTPACLFSPAFFTYYKVWSREIRFIVPSVQTFSIVPFGTRGITQAVHEVPQMEFGGNCHMTLISNWFGLLLPDQILQFDYWISGSSNTKYTKTKQGGILSTIRKANFPIP